MTTSFCISDGEVDGEDNEDSDPDAELPLEIPFGKKQTSPGSSSSASPERRAISKSPERAVELPVPAKNSTKNIKQKRKQPKRESGPKRKVARVMPRPPTLLRRVSHSKSRKFPV